MKQQHREVIKKLLVKHVEVHECISRLEEEGVHIHVLDQLDLFELVLDFIGFPPETEWSVKEKRPPMGETFSREAWEHLAFELKLEQVEGFIDELHADCEALKTTHPQFFTQN